MEPKEFKCGWCKDKMHKKFRKKHTQICRGVQYQAERMVQEIEEWLVQINSGF